jgi:hypothetical protein
MMYVFNIWNKTNAFRILKKKQRDRSWISITTWNLIDKHAFAVQWWQRDEVIHSLSKAIWQSLRKDWCQCAEKGSQEIETKIQSSNGHGAFELLCGWYHRHGGKSPRPTHKDLNLIRSQFRNLYCKVDPSGDPLPIYVSPAPVNDSIQDEYEIWHSCEAYATW